MLTRNVNLLFLSIRMVECYTVTSDDGREPSLSDNMQTQIPENISNDEHIPNTVISMNESAY